MQQNIALKDIRTDGNTQSRAMLDQDVVSEYAELVKDGGELPAVLLFDDGAHKWLADGFHRYFGYAQADRASIPAEVRTGTQRDAMIFSWGANASHGLRRTNADKRKAVASALADTEYAAKSDRELAKVCGVSHQFVSNMRKPAEKPEPKPKPEPKLPPSAPTGGTGTPAGGTTAGEVSTVDTSGASAGGATNPDLTDAELAHGDADTLAVLESTQRELEEAQALLAAAEADDLKAEVLKQARLAAVAQRRQSELMETINQREFELRRLTNTLRRIAKAVGEEDPSKVAAVVEEMARKVRAEAA